LPNEILSLREVLENIRFSAFKTSAYPVIIRIYANCENTQLKQASELLADILGKDNVLAFNYDITEEEIKILGPPEDYKNKFILMCDKLRFFPKQILKPEEDLDIGDDIDNQSESKIMNMPVSVSLANPLQNKLNERQSAIMPSSNVILNQLNVSEKKKRRQEMNEDFTKKIYLVGGRKLILNKFRYPWEVSEAQFEDLKNINLFNKKGWRIYNSQNLCYVKQSLLKFPTEPIQSLAEIIDESVVNINELWEVGMQMVGVFRGFHSKQSAANKKFFREFDGARCGYVMKKEVKDKKMLIEKKKPTSLFVISFNLLSINQIPQEKIFSSESNFTLLINIKGDPSDEHQQFETKFTSDGYKYVFKLPENDAEFMKTFKLRYPEEASMNIYLLLDGIECCKCMFLIKGIKEGYRVIPLCSTELKKYAFSSILGYFRCSKEEIH